jgi:antibiotic biosynthesis monooxygenase (ABM) superfamily enzyme
VIRPVGGWQGLGPMLAGNFLVAAVIVYMMVCPIMPHYTRIVAKWLYR